MVARAFCINVRSSFYQVRLSIVNTAFKPFNNICCLHPKPIVIMKRILLFASMCASLAAVAQNSLLKNPIKGAVPAKAMNKLCIVTNASDAVLVIGDTSGVYAIDAGPNNTSTTAENAITSIPNFVTKLDAAAGQATYVIDMAVNPVNKAIYILAMNSTASSRFLFKVEKAGSKVTMMDMSNVTYSKLSWGGRIYTNDIAYANNTLYVSSGSYNLNGELGWIAPPFTHNAAFTKRSTTFFKSNQGATYLTTAPLETIAVGKIAGKDRVMGVTTCAPGFSFETSKLAGSGLLKVSEDFNVNSGYCSKAVYMQHDNKDWLFALHSRQVYRIGKKYLDGSQVTANKYDNNAVELRDNAGNVTVPAEDLKLMSNTEYAAMAYWDHYRLLVIEGGFSGTNTLSLLQVSTATPPPASVVDITTEPLKVYPNPAKHIVNVELPQGIDNATVKIISMTGSVVMSKGISAGNSSVNVQGIPAGQYTISIQATDGFTKTGKITIE